VQGEYQRSQVPSPAAEPLSTRSSSEVAGRNSGEAAAPGGAAGGGAAP